MTSTRNFRELLDAQMGRGKLVCVGLDSDTSKLDGEAQLDFNRRIVELTKDIAQSYKLQSAMYEPEESPEGFWVMQQTIAYINEVAPGAVVIVDYKRGDIGNSNRGYIRLAFERLGADAVTVNPYMGLVDGMESFPEVADKGIIVLCRTSNKGGAEFQDFLGRTWVNPETGILYASLRHARIELGEEAEVQASDLLPLYQYVAHRICHVWNKNDNCALVVGATQPDELAQVRRMVGDMPILVPGVGAQLADIEAMLRAGLDSRGAGIMVNSSRGIIFADDPGQATLDLHNQLTTLRDKVRG